MEIIQYPHPTLRRVSKPLKRVDAELAAIVREMFELMYAAKGVGLAANQVDLPYRLFVINLQSDPAAAGEEQVFINPVLTSRKGNAEAEEGCLSLPGLYGDVMRSERVVLNAYNLAGEELKMELDGLFARAVQHEIDHLDGILFIDRLSKTREMEIQDAILDFEAQFAGRRQRGEIPDDAAIARRLDELERLRTQLRMRVIMMGTGPFAVPTLRRLYDSRHEVLALVTRPPRPLHGKSREVANPMRALAVERGTRVHEPESINTPPARMLLASYRPDLFVVCDYGQILKPEVLEIARLGGINLHASLLPKYRGAAPVNWAIYHGETETGVTVIHMTPAVDAGPAIAQVATRIGSEETAAELEPRLAELGAPAVLAAIDALEAGTARAIDQDPAQATRAPRLKKELGAVDWSRPAAAIANQVRALQPWPKTYTFWQRAGGQPLRLILEKVHVEPAAGQNRAADAQPTTVAAPGTVLEASGARLVVAAGENALAIDLAQPAGKRVQSSDEFLRGYGVRPGERFGP